MKSSDECLDVRPEDKYLVTFFGVSALRAAIKSGLISRLATGAVERRLIESNNSAYGLMLGALE
ncbi:MAG: hypothetical protein ACR2O8_02755, partial [Rhizobiaceae bacterium]